MSKLSEKYGFDSIKIEKGILTAKIDTKIIMIELETHKVLLFPSIPVSLAIIYLQNIKDLIKEMRWDFVIA